MRLESPQDFRGDLEEEAFVPLPLVPLSIAVLGLAIVGRRRDDKVECLVRELSEDGEAVN